MRRATVGDVMTTDVVTVRPDTPFNDIVRLLTQRGISGVPVLGPDGRVLGVVSESDLLRKEELVDVRDGVVTLKGQLDLKSLIPIAVHLTSAVEGVVRVVNELTFDQDDTTSDAQRYLR